MNYIFLRFVLAHLPAGLIGLVFAAVFAASMNSSSAELNSLASATVVVANDSGPAHLAAAVGTPSVVFFGPTDPRRTSPSGAPTVAIDRYVFCSPCYLKKCPYAHECMREITPEMALEAVEGLVRLKY